MRGTLATRHSSHALSLVFPSRTGCRGSIVSPCPASSIFSSSAQSSNLTVRKGADLSDPLFGHTVSTAHYDPAAPATPAPGSPPSSKIQEFEDLPVVLDDQVSVLDLDAQSRHEEYEGTALLSLAAPGSSTTPSDMALPVGMEVVHPPEESSLSATVTQTQIQDGHASTSESRLAVPNASLSPSTTPPFSPPLRPLSPSMLLPSPERSMGRPRTPTPKPVEQQKQKQPPHPLLVKVDSVKGTVPRSVLPGASDLTPEQLKQYLATLEHPLDRPSFRIRRHTYERRKWINDETKRARTLMEARAKCELGAYELRRLIANLEDDEEIGDSEREEERDLLLAQEEELLDRMSVLDEDIEEVRRVIKTATKQLYLSSASTAPKLGDGRLEVAETPEFGPSKELLPPLSLMVVKNRTVSRGRLDDDLWSDSTGLAPSVVSLLFAEGPCVRNRSVPRVASSGLTFEPPVGLPAPLQRLWDAVRT